MRDAASVREIASDVSLFPASCSTFRLPTRASSHVNGLPGMERSILIAGCKPSRSEHSRG
jgi:hypothetical protein